MKVALVSGGASGIGRAITAALGRDGYRVVVFDLAEGSDVQGDVSRAEDCERAVSAARSQGEIRVLCNVAGIRPTGTILETSEETWDRVMAVNLKGMFLLCRAAIPEMQKRGGGVIVNIGSTSGYAGKDHIAYCAAKGAVIPFTKSLAVDHAADRIRVNAVIPGFTQTAMTADFSPAVPQAVAGRSVAGRVGLPEDVAAAVCFLASDAASTVSGAVLEVGVLPGTLPGAR